MIRKTSKCTVLSAANPFLGVGGPLVVEVGGGHPANNHCWVLQPVRVKAVAVALFLVARLIVGQEKTRETNIVSLKVP